MKNSPFLLAIWAFVSFAGSSHSWGATYDVWIQCKDEGQVYQGTLDFDLNVSSWTSFGSCTAADTIPYTWLGKLTIPSLTLAFNGHKYVQTQSNYQELSYTASDCNAKSIGFPGADSGISIAVQDVASNEISEIEFRYDGFVPGGFPLRLNSVLHLGQFCTGLITK